MREDYGGNKDKRFVNFRGGESTYFSSIVPREYLTSDEAKNKNLSDSPINIVNIGADSKYCSFYQYINNVQCTNLSMYSNKDSLFSKEKGTDEWFYALNRNFELRKLIFNEILNFISSILSKYIISSIKKYTKIKFKYYIFSHKKTAYILILKQFLLRQHFLLANLYQYEPVQNQHIVLQLMFYIH